MNDESISKLTGTRSQELYPAPMLSSDGVVTLDLLQDLITSAAGDLQRLAAALFSKGNFLFRTGDIRGAIEAFSEGLKYRPEWEELRANSAAANLAAKQYEEALLQAKRALLSNPKLVLAALVIARVSQAKSELDQAAVAYDRVLSLQPTNYEALMALAELSEKQSSKQSSDQSSKQSSIGELSSPARDYLERLIRVYPDDARAQGSLAYQDFMKGRSLFQAGDLPAAFELWGVSYRRFARAYHTNKQLLTEMSQVASSYREKDYPLALAKFREAYRENPEDRKGLDKRSKSESVEKGDRIYPFVSQYLFSIGLFPEAYEQRETLAAEQQRWQQSLEKSGEHPYPHFRFALIHLYRGEWNGALSELGVCQDKFPPKKQGALKLRELFELVKLMQEMESQKDEFLNILRPVDEWHAAGFTNLFQLQPWKESGLAPREAALWRDAFFSAKQAVNWRKSGIAVEVAQEWFEAGFNDPQQVRVLLRGEFSPAEARTWSSECPLPLDQMVQSKKAGFKDPAIAYRWAQIFQFPWESIQWHELGFTPEESVIWREHGFVEPRKAASWRSKGHTAESALRNFNDPLAE